MFTNDFPGFKGEGLKLKDKFTEADSQLGNHEKVERPRCAKKTFKALSDPLRTQECMNITQHKKVFRNLMESAKPWKSVLRTKILPRISEEDIENRTMDIMDQFSMSEIMLSLLPSGELTFCHGKSPCY